MRVESSDNFPTVSFTAVVLREWSGRFLFPEHGEEGQKVVVAAVAVLDDGKDNLAVFILKLSLFHHLLEELCDVQWGIGKGSAAEGP